MPVQVALVIGQRLITLVVFIHKMQRHRGHSHEARLGGETDEISLPLGLVLGAHARSAIGAVQPLDAGVQERDNISEDIDYFRRTAAGEVC